jgi:carbon-monoxide dehydrogenase small subunit
VAEFDDQQPGQGIDVTVTLTVNGALVTRRVPAELRLIELLRDELALTGTKLGCGNGVCGACSVLVDGELMSSCLLLAVQLDGASVETVEGLSRGAVLTPLQSAFVDHGGLQCGACTPGQVVTSTALLRRAPAPSREEIRAWLGGNLCRCTGYAGIVRSVSAAAAVQ